MEEIKQGFSLALSIVRKKNIHSWNFIEKGAIRGNIDLILISWRIFNNLVSSHINNKWINWHVQNIRLILKMSRPICEVRELPSTTSTIHTINGVRNIKTKLRLYILTSKLLAFNFSKSLNLRKCSIFMTLTREVSSWNFGVLGLAHQLVDFIEPLEPPSRLYHAKLH